MTLRIANVSEYFGNGNFNLERIGNLNSNRESGQRLAIVVIDDLDEQHPQQDGSSILHDGMDSKKEKMPIQAKEDPPFPSVCDTTKKPIEAPILARSLTTPLSTALPRSDQAIKKERIFDLEESNRLPTTISGATTISGVPIDFREDLKRKIMERRQAEGKQMIDLEQEEEKRRKEQENGNKLTQEDLEKRLKKRLSNNMAAKRCRENRKQLETVMEKEMSVQKHRKRDLLQALTFLEHEKEVLYKLWKSISQGEATEQSKKTIQDVINTDYNKYIPEPLPVVNLTLDGDTKSSGAFENMLRSCLLNNVSIHSGLNGNGTVDGATGATSAAVRSDNATEFSGVECLLDAAAAGGTTVGIDRPESTLEVVEVNQPLDFSEIFSRDRLKKKILQSQRSVESCSSMEGDACASGSGSERHKRGAEFTEGVIDLTDDNDNDSGIDNDHFGSQSSTDSNISSYQASCRARQTLFELADATYTEMKVAEELNKQIEMSNCEVEGTREMECERDVEDNTDNNFDSDIDEDDFVPLVIDLAK